MFKFSLKEITSGTNGKLLTGNEDIIIKEVSTDSRTKLDDSLFVAIVGAKLDGHNYLENAYENGYRSFMIDKNHTFNKDDANIIEVDDTTNAFGYIAKLYKEKFNIPFVGITGSVGKTTTKDMVYSVLKEKYNTLKNEGNLNNEIGLPKTLFNLNDSYEVAVLEMGMDHAGQIRHLANIVNPYIAVISNIGMSHIEFFKDQSSIFDAKMEITANFDKNNILIVNGDDPFLKALKKRTHDYKLLTYGFDCDNDIYCDNYVINDDNATFTCIYNEKKERFIIPSPAKHNILNAMAATLVGLSMNISLNKIKKGLEHFNLSKSRLDIFKTNKYKVINDAYNASSDSMIAALDVLSHNKMRKVAILGDIFETGKYEKQIHEEVGKHILNNADILITVGNASKHILNKAIECGFDKNKTYHFDDRFLLLNEINNILESGDTVLIKASNGMKLEEVSEYLRSNEH